MKICATCKKTFDRERVVAMAWPPRYLCLICFGRLQRKR